MTSILIAGGTAIFRIPHVRWHHHQSNFCGHSCSLCYMVRLYFTQFLSLDNTFIARVKGCIM